MKNNFFNKCKKAHNDFWLYASFFFNVGKTVQHLFGKCTEAIYCGKAPSAKCLWRPGALPVDANLHYGFSRFAIELNEMLPKERSRLPRTDTRFRPDQRALEVKQI